MKTCYDSKCKEINPQSLNNFYKNKSRPDGLTSECKICCKRRVNAFGKKHRKRLYEERKEYAKEYNKKYRKENPEYFKKYRQLPKTKARDRERRILNADKLKKQSAARTKFRFKNDPAFRAICRVRNRVVKMFKERPKYSKKLGCSFKEFTLHIEKQFQPGMTWENYGSEWHIDHYFPLIPAYNLGPEVFAKACHYTNLRPLWAKENILKHDTIPEEFQDIKKFLAS